MKRKPAKIPGAPAIHKGIQPVDPQTLLAQATPEQLSQLPQHNFAVWSRLSGLKVDQRDFNFDTHRYLLPIYLCQDRIMAWMKSAQMGATIYEVLRLLWFCRYYQVNVALYFPTGDGVRTLSKARLNPIIKSNKELLDNLTDGDSQGLKMIQNIHGGQSSLYMLYLGGAATKDSVPLDVLGFDEVRLCDPDDIDQAIERISHSKFKYQMFVSTAGFPNHDIASRFNRGNQMYWHVRCNCSDGFIPSENFPDCILDMGDGGVPEKGLNWWDQCQHTRVFLRCPRCKYVIKNPQNGMYIPHNPGGEYTSFHISQLISAYISPKEIWTHFNNSTNKKEFYNAKLGKPYVDEENRPINDIVLESCTNTDSKWLYNEPRRDRRNCAMGIDVGGKSLYIVVVKRGPEGRKKIVHLELVELDNPRYWEGGEPIDLFQRADELMRHFDVGMCVVDGMPNMAASSAFANRHKGRVFVSWYGGEQQKDIVIWHDRARMKEGIRRGSKDIKLKYQVTLNRYTSFEYSLSEFVNRNVEMPHPDALVQVCRNSQGRFESQPLCRKFLWKHLKSLVRQKTIIGEAQYDKWRMEWVHLGEDHFAHAWNYANIAVERLKRKAIFSL